MYSTSLEIKMKVLKNQGRDGIVRQHRRLASGISLQSR